MIIPFNRPYLTGNEISYISQALKERNLAGGGNFAKRAEALLGAHLGSGRSLLTSSCTDALEAAAILCDLRPGDEVIVPSYTFVSTANAFALRGATIRFADSQDDHPNLAVRSVSNVISEKTRVIVPVHYAGVACDMEGLREQADAVGAIIVEDAAQAIASSYKGKPLGTFGTFSAFSFHETKNIIAGECGALHVNEANLEHRAEIVIEKGTNRSAFFRGQVDKYNWVSLGSSFLPSEITSAFLTAQLEALDVIQTKRLNIWDRYHERLTSLRDRGDVSLPLIPSYASNNAHMFYLVCDTLDIRSALIDHMRTRGINTTFHYQALHQSPYFTQNEAHSHLPNASRYSDCLVRMPLFAEMDEDMVDRVADAVVDFFM